MKSLEWVLENFSNLETCLDDRLGKRLCQFLTDEQMSKIGYSYENKEERPEIVPWTEENVLKQLKKDLAFGIRKATGHRGISASLMWEVCLGWCTVLENGLDKKYKDDYGYYGDKLFKAIDEKHNFGLVSKDTFDKDFYEEW